MRQKQAAQDLCLLAYTSIAMAERDHRFAGGSDQLHKVFSGQKKRSNNELR
jgi:hypothetical protein